MGDPLPRMFGVTFTPRRDVPPEEPEGTGMELWFEWAVRKVRLGMETYALNNGFEFCGIFEMVGDSEWRRDALYKRLWETVMAERYDVILIHGDVSMPWINRLTLAVGGRVYELPQVFPRRSTDPWNNYG